MALTRTPTDMIIDRASGEKLSSQLTDLASVTVIADSFKLQVPEMNDTARLQRALDSLNGNGTLVLSSGVTYQVTGLTVTGLIEIQGNNAILSSVASDNTVPMIKNVSATNTNLRITNLKFSGKNRAIEMVLNGSSPSVGTSLSLYKCRFDGLTRASDAIYLRQIDFVELTKINGANYNTFLTIESDYTISERDNTQIHLKNISLLKVNLGANFRQLDKATIDGFDISECGSGFYFKADNKRMQFNSCHVEKYGATGYDGGINYGYAFYFPDDKFQVDNSFNNCTSLLPVNNALGGFYLGQSETLLTNVLLENSYFAHDGALTNHKAVYLYGSYVWKGRFPYDDTSAKMYKLSMSKGNGIIEETGWAVHRSRNLLPFSLISSASQLSGTGGTGTISVANDTDGVFNKSRLITMTATGSYEKYTTASLKVGWHTLLLSAYKKTGNPYIYIQQLASPYTTLLKVLPSDTQNRIVRIPFYVPTAATYKIGFNPGADCSLVLNQIEIVRGFGKEFTTDPTISKQSAIPTEGYYEVGDDVVNSVPAASGYKGWVCVTAGSPGTFKGYGAIQA